MAALAQAPAAAAPASTRPALQYQSAFAGFRAYVDIEPIAWKKANDEAAAIGGPLGQMARDAHPGAVARPGATSQGQANPGAAGNPQAKPR